MTLFSLTTILPAVVMEMKGGNLWGSFYEDWKDSLDLMLRKWRCPQTVKKTARIVGLIALPAYDLQCYGIAPDDSTNIGIS